MRPEDIDRICGKIEPAWMRMSLNSKNNVRTTVKAVIAEYERIKASLKSSVIRPDPRFHLQLENPLSHRWVLIDRRTGRIVYVKKTSGRFKSIDVANGRPSERDLSEP